MLTTVKHRHYRPSELIDMLLKADPDTGTPGTWSEAAVHPLLPVAALQKAIKEVLKSREYTWKIAHNYIFLNLATLLSNPNCTASMRDGVLSELGEEERLWLSVAESLGDEHTLLSLLHRIKATPSLWSGSPVARCTLEYAFTRPAVQQDSALLQGFWLAHDSCRELLVRRVRLPEFARWALRHLTPNLTSYLVKEGNRLFMVESLLERVTVSEEWVVQLSQLPVDSAERAVAVLRVYGSAIKEDALPVALSPEQASAWLAQITPWWPQIEPHAYDKERQSITALRLRAGEALSSVLDTLSAERYRNSFLPLTPYLAALDAQSASALLLQAMSFKKDLASIALIECGLPLDDMAYQLLLEHASPETLQALLHDRVTVPEWVLQELSIHQDSDVRRCVAVHPSTTEQIDHALRYVRKSMQVSHCEVLFRQSAAFAPLSYWCNLTELSELHGYDLFDFKGVSSTRDLTRTMIGTAHPAECQFLFDAKCSSAVTAISALQSVFTTARGKLDRHNYLAALAKINASVLASPYPMARQRGLAVDAMTLKTIWSFLSLEEVCAVIAGNGRDEARDVFRMMAGMLEHDDEAIEQKQATLIRRWLVKNAEYGERLHRYLTDKHQREQGARPARVFVQLALTAVPVDLPEDVALILPTDSRELMALGRLQRHCVGTSFYADRCEDGSNLIFALRTGASRDDVFTFQYNRAGTCLQAKGFINAPVARVWCVLADGVAKTLLGALDDLSADALARHAA